MACFLHVFLLNCFLGFSFFLSKRKSLHIYLVFYVGSGLGLVVLFCTVGFVLLFFCVFSLMVLWMQFLCVFGSCLHQCSHKFSSLMCANNQGKKAVYVCFTSSSSSLQEDYGNFQIFFALSTSLFFVFLVKCFFFFLFSVFCFLIVLKYITLWCLSMFSKHLFCIMIMGFSAGKANFLFFYFILVRRYTSSYFDGLIELCYSYPPGRFFCRFSQFIIHFQFIVSFHFRKWGSSPESFSQRVRACAYAALL